MKLEYFETCYLIENIVDGEAGGKPSCKAIQFFLQTQVE